MQREKNYLLPKMMKRCNWKRLLPYCKIIRIQHLNILYLQINFKTILSLFWLCFKKENLAEFESEAKIKSYFQFIFGN